MIACKLCIMTKGLTLKSDHLFPTAEAMYRHLEDDHHIPVMREDETEEACRDRFIREQLDRVLTRVNKKGGE